MKSVQIDMFTNEEANTAPPVLNGMYYEKATDKFVSFALGKRYYEEPAKGCSYSKEWQNRIKRERSI